MNKSIRFCSSLLLAAAVFCGGAVTAAAADQTGSTQMYLPSGDNAVIQFVGSDNTFFRFMDIVPGDTLTQTIQLENRRNETVTFYLNGTDSYENRDLLEKITMTITNTDTNQVIYRGNMTGRPTTAYNNDLLKNNDTQRNGINLGNFAARSTARLKAVLYVPPEVDNDHADAVSKVTWEMRAQTPGPAFPGGTTPGRPGTGGGSSYPDTDSDGNTTTITDNDIPLAGDLFSIPDGQTPLADLPKTGGGMGLGGLMAGITTTAAALTGKRRQK